MEPVDSFISRNQINQQRAQMDGRAIEQQTQAENRELLLQLLANAEELKRVVAMHKDGEPIGEELMKEGQEVIAVVIMCHELVSFSYLRG
jgi:hypothetical protein